MNVERPKIETATTAETCKSKSSLPPSLRGGFQLREAAVYLGVSPMTVRRLVKRRLLKPNRATRHLLFAVKELNRFLEGQ